MPAEFFQVVNDRIPSVGISVCLCLCVYVPNIPKKIGNYRMAFVLII